MKECRFCRTIKDAVDFPKNNTSKDGLYSLCKVCKGTKNRKWKNSNMEREKENNRLHFQKNKHSIYKKRTIKRNNDIQYKISCNLRSRLGKAITNNHKTGSAVKELGCSIGAFKRYIESQFTEGMTWSNWNRTGWHIDHIIPLSKFNLTSPEELKKACHYTNLQPLWAKDNLRKGGK